MSDILRVALFGEVYSPNLGDAAIAHSVSSLFQTYEADVHLVDLSGRSTGYIIGDQDQGVRRRTGKIRSALRSWRWFRRVVTAIRWHLVGRPRVVSSWRKEVQLSDAVVIGGGHLFTDRDFGFPPALKLVHRLASDAGKPLAIFGVGASELGYNARRIYRNLLLDAVYISVRDEESKRLLGALDEDVASRIEVHPDPVFGLEPVIVDQASQRQGRSLILNILNPEHFRSHMSGHPISDEEFIGHWVRLAREAHLHVGRVVLATNGDPADHIAASKLSEALTVSHVSHELVDRPTSLEQLFRQYGDSADIIATRMHAGIVAMSLGARVAAIEWDRKVRDVWQTFGTVAHVRELRTLVGASNWAGLEQALSQSPTTGDQLYTEAHAAVVGAAGRCIQQLASRV